MGGGGGHSGAFSYLGESRTLFPGEGKVQQLAPRPDKKPEHRPLPFEKTPTDRAENDEILSSRSDPLKNSPSATDNDERAHSRSIFRAAEGAKKGSRAILSKNEPHGDCQPLDLSLGTVKLRIRLGVEKLSTFQI